MSLKRKDELKFSKNHPLMLQSLNSLLKAKQFTTISQIDEQIQFCLFFVSQLKKRLLLFGKECNGVIFETQREATNVIQDCLKDEPETTKKVNDKHVCDVCGVVAKSRGGLINHQKRKFHGTVHVIDHKCDICDKSFRKMYSLKLHLLTHTGERNFVCELCGQRFVQNIHLKAHLASHSGYRKYRCPFCAKTFVLKGTAAAHIQVCKSNPNLNMDLSSNVSSLYSPSNHNQCPLCLRILSPKINFMEHIKTHAKQRYQCEICPKRYNSNSLLKRHVVMHHTKERNFRCHECDKAFGVKDLLDRHLIIHTGERNYSCEICKRSFVQLGHLQAHMVSLHGEKRFACPFCDKVFALQGNRKQHLQVHFKASVKAKHSSNS